MGARARVESTRARVRSEAGPCEAEAGPCAAKTSSSAADEPRRPDAADGGRGVTPLGCTCRADGGETRSRESQQPAQKSMEGRQGQEKVNSPRRSRARWPRSEALRAPRGPLSPSGARTPPLTFLSCLSDAPPLTFLSCLSEMATAHLQHRPEAIDPARGLRGTARVSATGARGARGGAGRWARSPGAPKPSGAGLLHPNLRAQRRVHRATGATSELLRAAGEGWGRGTRPRAAQRRLRTARARRRQQPADKASPQRLGFRRKASTVRWAAQPGLHAPLPFGQLRSFSSGAVAPSADQRTATARRAAASVRQRLVAPRTLSV